MASIRQALAEAREKVSPLCEIYDSGGRKQWQIFWDSRRGRESSVSMPYAEARRVRTARIAGFAAEALAQERGMDDPAGAGTYAEEHVYSGETIENAVRRTMNYSA